MTSVKAIGPRRDYPPDEMDIANKKTLLDTTLTRAAEELGDVTAPVMVRFYRRFPDSLEAFETLWPGRRGVLEGEMVERALYCAMTWYDYPGEVEIVLLGSVPHHAETLKVSPDWYGGLLEALAETIEETIPVWAVAERRVWREVHGELAELVEQSAQYVRQ